MTAPRHFIDLKDLNSDQLRHIIDDGRAIKEERLASGRMGYRPPEPSTRTRVSFDVGMRELGGETLYLSGSELQLGRGETISDTAKVLSRYVDAIMIRTTDHDRIMQLSDAATVPVINGLTDDSLAQSKARRLLGLVMATMFSCLLFMQPPASTSRLPLQRRQSLNLLTIFWRGLQTKAQSLSFQATHMKQWRIACQPIVKKKSLPPSWMGRNRLFLMRRKTVFTRKKLF